MRTLGLLGSIGLASVIAGCGDSSSTCPPEFPIMRDGMCLRADGGGMDGGTTLEDAGGGTDAGSVDSAIACNGWHPQFSGGLRWCDPDCYCSDTDTCYPADIADECCSVDVVCGAPDASVPEDSGVACNGEHPLLRDTPPQRYCAPGNCYCGDPTAVPPIDVCYPNGMADACCPVGLVCY